MAVRIMGTGSYVPDRVLTNEDLEKLVDTSDAWITERTGIWFRRISENGTGDMAVRAAEAALTDAGVLPEELDLIIVGTSTGDFLFPNTACQVQAAIGAEHAACFDLSAACSGFLFSMNTAAAYLNSGTFQKALVIGADALSKTVDWKDRGTCILFGDGAGAVVLQGGAEKGIGPFVMGSDGNRGGCLTCASGRPEPERAPSYLSMNGQEVFRFAVRTVPEVIETTLEKAGLTAEDIKYFILHQANKRIIESVAKRMKQPLFKFPMNLERYGNTSGASIPLLLDELHRQGKLERGNKLILAGFGAGFTWGATVVTW